MIYVCMDVHPCLTLRKPISKSKIVAKVLISYFSINLSSTLCNVMIHEKFLELDNLIQDTLRI